MQVLSATQKSAFRPEWDWLGAWLIAATTTTAAAAAAVGTGTATITTAATGTARPRRTTAVGVTTASAPTRRVSPTTRASHRPPPLHASYLRTVSGNALHLLYYS